MSVKKVIVTHLCNICGEETTCESNADWEIFEVQWFSSLNVDLCAVCKITPKGLVMIHNSKKAQKELTEKFVLCTLVGAGAFGKKTNLKIFENIWKTARGAECFDFRV